MNNFTKSIFFPIVRIPGQHHNDVHSAQMHNIITQTFYYASEWVMCPMSIVLTTPNSFIHLHVMAWSSLNFWPHRNGFKQNWIRPYINYVHKPQTRCTKIISNLSMCYRSNRIELCVHCFKFLLIHWRKLLVLVLITIQCTFFIRFIHLFTVNNTNHR